VLEIITTLPEDGVTSGKWISPRGDFQIEIIGAPLRPREWLKRVAVGSGPQANFIVEFELPATLLAA
jgi:hypothetical protein